MNAHETLEHRLEARALLVGEVGEPQLLAGEDLRVLADQILDLGLGLGLEGVVGRGHVRELGVAAFGRNRAGVQQRVLRRDHLERAVGVPESIAEGEQPAAIVTGEHLVVLVEIGHVGEGGGQPILVRSPQARADRELDLAEATGEGQLLRVVDRLAVEDQHGVPVHRSVDRLDLVR